ncbi:MAG: hypothetical protein IIT88_04500 [Acetobacter sp.]|nr:hypothetical protein [Acetobacter sp.]
MSEARLLREYTPVAECLGVAFEGRTKQNTLKETPQVTPKQQPEGYFG